MFACDGFRANKNIKIIVACLLGFWTLGTIYKFLVHFPTLSKNGIPLLSDISYPFFGEYYSITTIKLQICSTLALFCFKFALRMCIMPHSCLFIKSRITYTFK